MPSATTAQRYPFKIIRGQFSRREGDPQPFVDPATGQRTRRKSRPFVLYSVRTPDNPRARDEVLLTEAEAAHLNRHGRRFVRLFKSSVRETGPAARPTGNGHDASEGAPAAHGDGSEGDQGPMSLRELLEVTMASKGAGGVRAARQLIFDAKVTDLPLPHKKADLIAMLQALVAKDAEARAAAGEETDDADASGEAGDPDEAEARRLAEMGR